MSDGDEWLDFKEIKARLDARAVLSHLGLLEHLEERGAEWVGWCPFGDEHGKKDSFAVNIEKKTFQCFACKARGSILDLVAKLRNCNLRGAAQVVLSVMDGGAVGEEKRGGRPYGKERGTETATTTGGEMPKVMTFSVASRLIIGKKLNPENLLVVDISGFDFHK
jgi:DNA primase